MSLENFKLEECHLFHIILSYTLVGGIRTMKIGDLPKSQKFPSVKGHIIVINRGTKIRKI